MSVYYNDNEPFVCAWLKIRLDPWAGCEFIPCRDGKVRPVEPATFPLA